MKRPFAMLSPAAQRLALLTVAMTYLESLEEETGKALEDGRLDADALPADLLAALRHHAQEVLDVAPPWEVVLEAARDLEVPVLPFGGRDGYVAFLQSTRLYFCAGATIQ